MYPKQHEAARRFPNGTTVRRFPSPEARLLNVVNYIALLECLKNSLEHVDEPIPVDVIEASGFMPEWEKAAAHANHTLGFVGSSADIAAASRLRNQAFCEMVERSLGLEHAAA